MDKNEIKYGRLLVELMAAGLTGKPFDPADAQIDMAELLEMAETHQVLVMAVKTLQASPRFSGDPLLAARQNDVGSAVWQSRVQHLELGVLCKRFSQAGIPVIPLKGSLLKTLYPKVEYRQMCDLDLLVRPEQVPQAREVLTAAGYTLEEIGEFHRDSFVKSPFMEIELHSRLLPDKEVSDQLFGDLWDRATPSEAGIPCWTMSKDDFYVFMVLHFAKHYKFRGSGIRSVMDMWLYLQKHGNELDEGRLSQVFNDSGLTWFRETAEKLANVWFGNGKHDRQTRNMEMNLLCSGGIYGSDDQYMRNHLMWVGMIDRPLEKIVTKVRFLSWRILPPLRTMRIRYPLLERIPLLLPVFWLIRIADAVFKSGVKTWKEAIGIFKA